MKKVVHFEIPADDMNRAKEFYEKVFDWNIMPFDPVYYLAVTVPIDEKTMMPKEPGAINGGIMARMKEVPNPTIFIEVEDLDWYLKKIEAAGGKLVTPKTEVPQMLWFARIQDTEGNIIGIIQPMYSQ